MRIDAATAGSYHRFVASKRAALFLDFDNFAIEFEKNDAYFGVRDGMFFPQLLVHFLESKIACEIIQKRAYGEFNLHTNRIFKDQIWKGTEIRDIVRRDWEQRDSLMTGGFEFVYCPALHRNDERVKNGADIELCIDAVSIAAARGDIDTFFIASGDADMIGTCRRLRAQGKYVVLVVLRARSAGRYSDIVSEVLCFDPKAVLELTCGPLDAAVAALGEKGVIEQSALRAEVQRRGFDPRLAGYSWAGYFEECLNTDDWFIGDDGRVCSVKYVANAEQAIRDTEDVVEQFLRGWDLRNLSAEERRRYINILKQFDYSTEPTLATLSSDVSVQAGMSKTKGNALSRLLKHVGFFLDAQGEPVRDHSVTRVCGVADIGAEQLRRRTTEAVASLLIDRTGVDARMFATTVHAKIFANRIMDRTEDDTVRMVVEVFSQLSQTRQQEEESVGETLTRDPA